MKRKAMYMAGISLSFFPLFGCTAVGNYCDNTKPIIKDVSSSENKTKIPGYICELENIESSIHDGVYRTYSLGAFFSEETLVTLESEMLLDEIDSPDTICVYSVSYTHLTLPTKLEV